MSTLIILSNCPSKNLDYHDFRCSYIVNIIQSYTDSLYKITWLTLIREVLGNTNKACNLFFLPYMTEFLYTIFFFHN